MRFVLVEADDLLASLVEGMLADLGHEVVGVSGTPADAVEMIRSAHPDAVVVDPAVGYGSDFDVLDAARRASATTILFTYGPDHGAHEDAGPRRVIVAKPDLAELERVVSGLGQEVSVGATGEDRRSRPSRSAAGRPPTNLADAEAFYDALNEATEGDAVLAVALYEVGGGADGFAIAARIQELVRDGDRVLASARSVRVFLPGAEELGVGSFTRRLERVGVAAPSARVTSVVLGPGERPADAFDRLRDGDG
jgi:CheY-like chemotaxis protein